MLAIDVIAFMNAELEPLGSDPATGVAHYGKPFGFGATVIDAQTLALFVPVPLAQGQVPRGLHAEALLRRMLEANLQGVETGKGALCLTAQDVFGYREIMDLREMQLEAFRMRFVDFTLYADYWRSEAGRILADELGISEGGLAHPDEGMIRL